MRRRSLTFPAALAVLMMAGAAVSLAAPAPGRLASKPLEPPAGPGAMAPNLALAGNDVLLTWLEPLDPKAAKGGKGHRLRFARLSGDRWSAPVTIVSSPKLLANWADFPGAIQSPDGSLVVHWLESKVPGTYDYFPRVATSADGGKTWKTLGPLPSDVSVEAENGFVSWVPEGKGVRGFWLDGRELQGSEQKGAMALRTAVLGKAGGEERLDGRVCTCCQTDAAVTAAGPVIAYRDRSDQEIRDISVIRRTPKGWSQPVRVHADGWKIPGCPVNGPAVAASGRRVAVAWFTAAKDARVLVAFSEDGGASFGPATLIDGDGPIGRVDVALDPKGDALVLWQAADGDGAEIRLRRVTPQGKASPPATIAATSAARSSGFPRMVLAKGRLVLAWVEDGQPSKVRAAALPLTSIQ